MADLQSFIEKYLKNKKISDYEGWLALYGRDSEAEYRRTRTEADTRYAADRAEHGKTASALYEKGLSGSGYSDYLNSTAYAARMELYDKARVERQESESENRRGYLAYLNESAKAEEEAQAKKQKEQNEIFKDLLSKNIMDRDSAVTYLVGRGIDEESAVLLADQSIEILHGTKSYITKISNEVREMFMDYQAAYEYARSKGVSEELARSVAQIAQAALSANDYGYYK